MKLTQNKSYTGKVKMVTGLLAKALQPSADSVWRDGGQDGVGSRKGESGGALASGPPILSRVISF